MQRTQLEQSPVAPGKLQPCTGADAVGGVHAEKGLLARLGEAQDVVRAPHNYLA